MSTASSVFVDESDGAIARINNALCGPVTEILQKLIPELGAYSRREAYERILTNPPLASHCFAEFRQHPELFQTLLEGPNGAVTDDDQPLSCGKTLAEVIALIVRAVAKRHFRTRLNTSARATAAARRQPSVFQRVAGWFQPPPPPPKPRSKVSRGDALYRALRDFLLFEWQILLIPQYARIPLPLAKSLGPRLLECREPEQVRELIRNGVVPSAEAEPPSAPVPGEVVEIARLNDALTPRQASQAKTTEEMAGRLKTVGADITPIANAMWAVSRQLKLADLFNNNEQDMRRLVLVASTAGLEVRKALIAAGLRPQLVVVALCTLAHYLGSRRMQELLGPGAPGAFLDLLAPLLRKEQMAGLDSPGQVRATMEHVLTQLNDALLLEMAGW